jgi:hypothetical protein
MENSDLVTCLVEMLKTLYKLPVNWISGCPCAEWYRHYTPVNRGRNINSKESNKNVICNWFGRNILAWFIQKILREKRRSVKLFLFFISRTPEPNRVRNIDKKRQMLFTSAFFRLDKGGF